MLFVRELVLPSSGFLQTRVSHIFALSSCCLSAVQVVEAAAVAVKVMRLYQMGAKVLLHWEPLPLVRLLISARDHKVAIDCPISLRTSRSV